MLDAVLAKAIGPGLWRWTAPHPGWRTGAEPDSPGDWDQMVGSVLFEAADAVALVDPLLPVRGREELLAWLDAQIEDRPVSILTTIRWHRRDRDALARRYAGRSPRPWNAVPKGVEPHPLRGAGETLFWLPAAAALARTAGFERFRALWQMRRSLSEPLDQPALPAGRALRSFVPGQDEDEWLRLNGRAFAKHPEQGGWTRHDLDLREREPWFDPAGFFIAERDGHMTGFHWTKMHSPTLGEVYVVGVDPDEQGSGLGRALTLAGLRHLRDRGVAQAMLYVDEDNVPAIRMYEGLGFTRTTVDAMYRRGAQR